MDKYNIANLDREAQATETVNIGIVGMTCDECVQKVERAFRELPGVKEVTVDQTAAIATVTFDDSIDVPTLHDALLRSGYKPVATTVR
jgi:P-type Cu+ transporter